MRALQIAATGMSAQQMRVEVISNNLANMSTTGYNARRAEFADLMYQQATRPGTITAIIVFMGQAKDSAGVISVAAAISRVICRRASANSSPTMAEVLRIETSAVAAMTSRITAVRIAAILAFSERLRSACGMVRFVSASKSAPKAPTPPSRRAGWRGLA